MLATFCLRLACGLAGSLLLLSSRQVAPRFFRTQFLIILGLLSGALVFLWQTMDTTVTLTLTAGLVLAFLGSLVWSLEGSPGGMVIAALETMATIVALALQDRSPGHAPDFAFLGVPAKAFLPLLDDLTSAALLGSATSAMLMGHSYLVAPAMALTPLLRLTGALFVCLGLRMAVAGIWLWYWFGGQTSLADTALWLPVRWGIGFIVPLVLAWMAWQSARIRSTQSATGILYVVVIFVFLGELISLLVN